MTSQNRSMPLGVTPHADGITVAIFSAHATLVEFCLFDETGEREIARIPLSERTGDIHHAVIPGVAVGARYGLRAHGPFDPAAGHRFNPAKLLADPDAVAFDRRFTLHPAMFGLAADDRTDSTPFMPKAVVSRPAAPFAGARPDTPWDRTILYEMNLRGFTMRHPDIPEALRGTFAGLAHPAALAHLTGLGVTAVELLPVAAFIDERHLPPLGLTNAWGYNPVVFGAPDPKLAPGGWDEIRTSIATLHAAGLEVILDVVVNHSGESDEFGPTISFRGLDNASYYRLLPDDPSRYVNDMGCGNSLALDRAPLVRLVMDNLRRWARAGVDGFRFDLATALGRRAAGFDREAPLLAAIGQDPELSALKLIAEPWDIGPGGYQTGQFPAEWAEWNDRYRDTIRRFWRGEPGQRGDLATRITGSSDLFGAKRRPSRSINFVTAHDGFTLADLVSYEHKANTANGENNRDGTDANHSWNNRCEGPSDDPEILAARRRDQINLLATLLFSRGTPMLSMGAELGQTQGGNNNAYAQDNTISWLDWQGADAALLEAAKRIIATRKAVPLLAADRFLTGHASNGSPWPDALWINPDGSAMSSGDWSDTHAATIIVILAGENARRIALAIHRGRTDMPLVLPKADAGLRWHRVFDSAQPGTNPGPDAACDTLHARSVALFCEEPAPANVRGPSGASLDALAALAGIAGDWWDHGGNNHVVTYETKRALLTAMGLDVGARSSAEDCLARMRRDSAQGLPSSAFGTAHAGSWLTCRQDKPNSLPRILTLIDETGEQRAIEIESTPLRPNASGTNWQAQIRLPPLPPGRYHLIDEARQDHICHLSIAPARGHAPAGARTAFGFSAQLYALRSASDQGIGDLTTLAEAATRAARLGAATFGINPLHALFASDPERASPYHPSDRRFLDPTAIDIAALGDLPDSALSDSLLRASLPKFDELRALRSIDYQAVAGIKTAYLRAKFEAFRTVAHGDRSPLWRDFLGFVERGGGALERFAAFRALERQFGNANWRAWPDGFANPHSSAVDTFIADNQLAIGFEAFCQWLAERQLAAAAEKARTAGLGLGLYRDLAVGCAPDSAEAWAGGDQFATGASVGAPPDPFSAEGQNWCLPPPNPLTMAAGGYATFRTLLAANMRHAGMLRIDHVMGLSRLFWVPDGAKTSEGAYVAYPRDALLAEIALESARNACVVVGEDLGTVPEGFRESLAAKGVLSYRVLWFERDGTAFKPPQSYPEDAVACVSTHDLATLAGWWLGADIHEQAALGRISDRNAARAARSAEKAQLLDALDANGLAPAGVSPDEAMTETLAAAIHAFIAQTPCVLAFAQVDDLAGETVAVNLPGTDRERPNWRRRIAVPVEDLFGTPLSRAITAALARRSA